jgi:ABC-type amino acid transport substrate-binding protein
MSQKKLMKAFMALIVILFVGCNKTSSPHTIKLGMDPSFIPLNSMGQESHISGYVSELFQKVGDETKISIELAKLSWDDLLPQLRHDKLDGIITTISPYNFYKKDFEFSDPIVSTGPCLISKKEQKISNLDQLNGKIIGIILGSSAELIASSNGGITIQSFESPSSLLDALVRGQIDAAMLDYLIAYAYTQDLYQKTLIITSSPYGDQGIRFMVKKTNNQGIKVLEALNSLLKESSTSELLQKWQLPAEM